MDEAQSPVLAGWSGGGSLSVFYQQQAQHPTVTASPSGDGPDLTTLGLIPADAIISCADLHHTETTLLPKAKRNRKKKPPNPATFRFYKKQPARDAGLFFFAYFHAGEGCEKT